PMKNSLIARMQKAPTNVEAYLLFTKNNGTRGQTALVLKVARLACQSNLANEKFINRQNAKSPG
ncbi:hypothetical protein M0D73_21340, partial [Shewanella putrefaciens]|uniref:hypothetical protein n=1 Tax=unclassified Shewanella TaxID=196818 RepID=UPI002006447A